MKCSLATPVIFTGKTRRRWLFLTQYQYYGPVLPRSNYRSFDTSTWPRDYYWSYDKPSEIKK